MCSIIKLLLIEKKLFEIRHWMVWMNMNMYDIKAPEDFDSRSMQNRQYVSNTVITQSGVQRVKPVGPLLISLSYVINFIKFRGPITKGNSATM